MKRRIKDMKDKINSIHIMLKSFKFLTQEKRYIFCSFLKMIMNGIQPFIAVIFPAIILDEIVKGAPMESLILFVVIMVLFEFICSATSTILTAFLNQWSERIHYTYLAKITQKALEIPYYMQEDNAKIEQMREAKAGITRIGGIAKIIDQFFVFFQNIITIVGSIILITSLDIWLTVAAIGSIVLSTVIQSKLKQIDIEFWNNMVGYNTRFYHVAGIVMNRKYAKDIRIFDAKDTFINQMDQFVSYIKDEFSTRAKKQFKCNGKIYFIDMLQQTFTYAYLAYQLIKGKIGIGGFSMVVGSIQSFTNSTIKAMESFLDLLEYATFIRPSIEFLNTSIKDIEGRRKLESDMPMIEFQHVSFQYPNSEQYVLRDINLKIPYGYKLCIVGMNGAGKSTLVKLLLRLYPPTQGEILLNGINIWEYDWETYTNIFATLFQDFKLLPFNIRENISFEEPISEEKLEEVLKKAGVWKKVEKLKYGTETQVSKLFDMEGIDFSGGEAQKLAIARALRKEASVLILDEPTAALDPKMEDEIYSRFHQMVEDKTAIYISHRMTSCLYSDAIAVFDRGELVQYGTHKQLIQSVGKYAEMYNIQGRYYINN